MLGISLKCLECDSEWVENVTAELVECVDCRSTKVQLLEVVKSDN